MLTLTKNHLKNPRFKKKAGPGYNPKFNKKTRQMLFLQEMKKDLIAGTNNNFGFNDNILGGTGADSRLKAGANTYQKRKFDFLNSTRELRNPSSKVKVSDYNPLNRLDSISTIPLHLGPLNKKNRYQADYNSLIKAEHLFTAEQPLLGAMTNIDRAIVKTGTAGHFDDIPKKHQGLGYELAPNVLIVGSTNSGKSTLVTQIFRNEIKVGEKTTKTKSRVAPVVSEKAGSTCFGIF